MTMEEQAVIQQVQKRMLISIGQVARKLGIKEGDYVRVEVAEDGASLRIVPVDWHLKGQEYFWREEWQQKLLKSLRDLDEGRFKTFEGTDDLIRELENAAGNKDR